jgi:mannose-6-phosphate isomerase
MTIKYTADEIWEEIEGEVPVRIDKPWGYYIVHHETQEKSVCVKTLVINPGCQISVQYHKRRSEFWYISEDNSLYELRLDGVTEIKMGKRSINIPVGMIHSIKNMSSIPLVIHEMQYGFCSDHDIVRISDPYADQR